MQRSHSCTQRQLKPTEMFVRLLLRGFLEQLMTDKYDDGDDEMSIEYANVCNADDDDDVKEGDVRD